MSKKIKTLIIFNTLIFVFLMMSKTVFASENIEIKNNTLKGQSVESGVKISKASWFKVTIPKNIVLDGSKKDIYSQNYKVTIEGDLSGHETIYVEPDTSFILSDSLGQKQIRANITQQETSFTVPKVGTLKKETTGTISTSKIEAGSYKGSFNFVIHKDLTSEHDWDSYKEENGYVVRYCKICGEKEVKNIITYNIDYILNNGSATNPSTYNVETKTFNLNNSERTGYTFTGWTGSNGNTPQTTVTIPKGTIGDKNYTANWTPINYTITYNYNGGNTTNPTSYTIESDTIKLNNPLKQGFRFLGWTGSNGNTSQLSVSIPKGSYGDKSFTANWSTSLTVNLEDWAVDKNNNKVLNITNKVPLSTDSAYTSKTIYIEKGNSVDGADWGHNTAYKAYLTDYLYRSSSGSTVVNTDGTTVYRYWYPRLDLNNIVNGTNTGKYLMYDVYIDGTLTSQNTYDFCTGVPCGSSIEIKNFRIENGYKLTTNVGTSVKKTKTNGNQSIDFTVQSYSFTAPTAKTLTYNETNQALVNAGTTGSGQIQYSLDNKNYSTSMPTGKEAKTYTVYYKVVDSTNYAQTEVKSINVKISPAPSYTITYNLDGGNISGQKTSYTQYDAAFSLPIPTKSGYFFAGWTGTGLSSATRNVTVNKGSTGNRTYTATWSTTAVGYYNNEAYDLIKTNGYTFVKVFRHDSRNSTFFNSEAEALNTGTKDATKYSRLGIIQNLKTNTQTKYVFRLRYPKGGNYDAGGNDRDYINIWKQTNRPQDEKNSNTDSGAGFVTGYEAISIDLAGNYWGGLEHSTSSATLIDGSTSHSNWFYAIGSYQKWGSGTSGTNTTIPGGTITAGKNDGYTSIFLVDLWLATDESKFTFK